MRKLNVRILALALILVFTQKLGLRIWMHNWLHETRALTDCSLPCVDAFHTNCGCMDDFVMPLLETPAVTIPAPLRQFIVLPTVDRPVLSTVEPSFAALRGPPIPAVFA